MAITASAISEKKAEELLLEFFNIEGTAKLLYGEVDWNFRIDVNSEPLYLLKISRDCSNLEEIEFQNDLLERLAGVSSGLIIPRVLEGIDGNQIQFYTVDTLKMPVRLMRWIPGRLWSSVNPKTRELRNQLGKICGALTRDFQIIELQKASKEFHWDISQSLWTKNHLEIFDQSQAAVLSYFQDRFQENFSAFESLRKGWVHNDANDNNIIVSEDKRNPEVRALIDFGDCIYTHIINDVAVAVTYAAMNLNDPLAGVCEVLSGYNSAFPVQEKELDFLYDCIGMRLVISLTKSALNAQENPENIYLQVSDKDAWELIKKWHDLSPGFARFAFRQACGYEPHPNSSRFINWAKQQRLKLTDLFPEQPNTQPLHLDLSVGSLWVGHQTEFNDLDTFQFKIQQLQKQHPQYVIQGGYLEPRSLYTSTAYDKMGNSGRESRTIHLGIDYWFPANTAVHALFDGEVVIAVNDSGDKEYGGLVVLKHQADDFEFFTLHGHLTVDSATSHNKGDLIKKGELVGRLGNYPENGNWAPHLHFQIILDLLTYTDDFPGVCYPNQIDILKSLCPDPALLFNQKSPDRNYQTAQLITYRKEHLGKGMSLHYDKPLQIVRGSGAYLIDALGRKYLDTVNNVAHVGHEHPDVVKSGQEQMALLNTNTRYLHPKINELAQALIKTMPRELSVVHFVNSGSEANELAIRMARTVTGERDMIASQVGYHGNTNTCVEMSSYKFDGKGGMGKPEYTEIFPLPDRFRGKFRGNTCSDDYLKEVRACIERIQQKGRSVAGLILESIISCGGQIELPEGFLKGAYELIRKAGGVCIADEVQTGCGRVGSHYWAFQLHDVVPDIVTIGKPLGNGHPVAAVVCTPEIAERFANGMEYFNTFGGNPVSCAIGNEVLAVLERENLMLNARKTGDLLKTGIQKLAQDFPIIGDVRGHGLFLGFELVDENLNPLSGPTEYLVNRMKEYGILMSSDGPDHNVIKIKPPMVFSKDHANDLFHFLRKVLAEDYMQLK